MTDMPSIVCVTPDDVRMHSDCYPNCSPCSPDGPNACYPNCNPCAPDGDCNP